MVTLGEALGRIPRGYALDHLCEHWRIEGATLVKTGGATCKLAHAHGFFALKIQAEGDTPAEAVLNAIAKIETQKES